MIEQIQLKNLNDMYVVVKHYNGKIYFKRKGYVTDVKDCPTKDSIYETKQSAEEARDKFNSQRQKVKYTIENASKYFINVYQVNGWYNQQITNAFVAIKDFQANKVNMHNKFVSFQDAIKHLKTIYTESVKTFRDRQERELKEVKRRLEDTQKHHEKEMKDLKNSEETAIKVLEYISNTDAETIISPFVTQADKIAKLLYNKG